LAGAALVTAQLLAERRPVELIDVGPTRGPVQGLVVQGRVLGPDAAGEVRDAAGLGQRQRVGDVMALPGATVEQRELLDRPERGPHTSGWVYPRRVPVDER